MARDKNRYVKLIEEIFHKYYKRGKKELLFKRDDIVRAAKKLKVTLPKNIGDVLYSFRYRIDLPDSIRSKAPEGHEWLIIPKGAAQYAFVARKMVHIAPNGVLTETKIPDATPGIIAKYALNDEQALLAIIRYNRLIDIFTGVTCYSLQSHLRTHIKGIGQIETDEIYVGVNKRGVHYLFPIQVKSHKDKIGIVQIEQDLELGRVKFPQMICIPIAAQFIHPHVIALFQFERSNLEIAVSNERHYRLVTPDELTDEELTVYQGRTE